jgi:beta-glucosidase
MNPVAKEVFAVQDDPSTFLPFQPSNFISQPAMPSSKSASQNSFAPEVTELIRQMTLKEKILLLAGKDDWNFMGVARLGVPDLAVMDGPHGVRIVDDGRRWKGPVVAFPTGASMATCWNPVLLEKVAGAIAEEVAAVGGDILLGPCINIVRHPLNGRTFETFSEDPYLNGQLAIAYINGMQDKGVGTSLKHFACNNQEVERMRGSSEVDERTMREIYLPAFETTVKEAKPWTVMCAYNRVNGKYASESSYLLTDILRKEWGFEGIVVSDWGATHSTVASVEAGLDIEMPGPAKFTRGLEEAVATQQIDEETIDESVGRILTMIVRSGRMGKKQNARKKLLNTPEHVALARELAEESIVLLKNEKNLLPLKADGIKSIAVLGPNANQLQTSGGGSAEIDRPFRLVTPIDALRERLDGKVELKFEEGALNYEEPPIMDIRRLTPAQGEGYGLWGEYFDNMEFKGEPALRQVDRSMNLWWGGSSPCPEIKPEAFSARWTGTVNVPHPTKYTFTIWGFGEVRVYLDDKKIIDFPESKEVTLDLAPGRNYGFRVEFVRPPSALQAGFVLGFGVARGMSLSGQIENAVKLAASSDVAIIFAGMCRRFEQEGTDRPHLNLPGNQDEMIRAVVRANPKTIVVLNAGCPVAMPWADDVPAILDLFYPGQDGGSAIVDILLGDVNPSGKLAVSFPKRLEDTPAFLDYPGGRFVHYGEGIFVGYRWYDKRQLEPLFPFGFGLSYTTFEYGAVAAPKSFRPGEEITVSVSIKNTGKVAGKEVVQLYVHDLESSVTRPVRELKGFAKVDLAPGENKTVSFQLGPRAFSFYDPHRGEWMAEPGDFEIQFGSSSRDIRAKAALTLEK